MKNERENAVVLVEIADTARAEACRHTLFIDTVNGWKIVQIGQSMTWGKVLEYLSSRLLPLGRVKLPSSVVPNHQFIRTLTICLIDTVSVAHVFEILLLFIASNYDPGFVPSTIQWCEVAQ